MTTFQDPPPQSRRAVRQSERGDAEQVAYPPFSQQPPFTQPGDQHQREMWDTAQRRAAQPPAAPAAPASGRRAAAPAVGTPEPLTYTTQGRTPVYDGPFQNVSEPANPVEPAAGDLPPTQALPKQDQPTYRVRDYAPSAYTPAPTWTTDPAAGDLDYQTAARVPAAPISAEPVPAAPVAAAPVAEVPLAPAPVAPEPAHAEPPAQTLTRRELRAMLHNEAEEPQDSAPVQAEDFAAPVAALAQPEAVVPAPVPLVEPAAPVSVAPVDAAEEKPWPFAFGAQPEHQAPVEPVAAPAFEATPVVEPPVTAADPVAPATPADGARALFGDIMTPISQPLPPIAPEVQPNTGLTRALTEFDTLAAEQLAAPAQPAPVQPAPVPPAPVQEFPVAPAQPAPAASVAPAAAESRVPEPTTPEPTWTRPVGHWSTQADLDDETQPYESTINRKVGSGHATTNALVLPITPERDIRGALTGTGEIMLTGSIDLPASLSASGTTARHDHDGLDSLFEGGEHELVPTDSQPVRALRAVSTHATGQGVTHTQKPKGNKVLTGLLIAASAMALVGVSLLVVVVVMNVL